MKSARRLDLAEIKWKVTEAETGEAWHVKGTAYGYLDDDLDDGDVERRRIGRLTGLLVPNATRFSFFDSHDAVDQGYCSLAEHALAEDILAVSQNPLSIDVIECAEEYRGMGFGRAMLYALTQVPLVWDVAVSEVFAERLARYCGGLGLVSSTREGFDGHFLRGGRAAIASACRPQD